MTTTLSYLKVHCENAWQEGRCFVATSLPSLAQKNGWDFGASFAYSNISHLAKTIPAIRSGALIALRGMQTNNDNVVIVPRKK